MQAVKSPKSPSREINVIEYSQSVRKANLLTKKGRQSQTASLNINLKTLNKNELLQMPLHNVQEKKIINEFFNNKANFSSTRKLFGVDQFGQSSPIHTEILIYMKRFYHSSKIINRIMDNDNMEFTNKIILLKFVEKIRYSVINPKLHNNWKEKF